MTLSDHGHLAPARLSGSAPLAIRIRHAHRDDESEMGYLFSSWGEGVKVSSSRLDRMPWPDFKRLERPRLGHLLRRADTELLVADLDDGLIAGWIAWSPGRRVDTVHWTFAKWQFRRRGVMRALVDAVGLKAHVVYTHRGAKRSDNWIVPWLGRRGVTAAFVPLKEWIA